MYSIKGHVFWICIENSYCLEHEYELGRAITNEFYTVLKRNICHV